MDESGGCTTLSTACIDGGTYGLSCTSADGVSQTCSCTIDGAETAVVTPEAPEGCLVSTYFEAADEACGFPRGALVRG